LVTYLAIVCNRVNLILLIVLSAGSLRAQTPKTDTTKPATDSARFGGPAALTASAVQIRMMTEGTITYKLTCDAATKEEAYMLQGASYILSLKGSRVRTDFTGDLGVTTSIYSSLTHAGALIREYGQEKILVRMTKDDFEDLSRQYQNMSFTLTGDTATIAGYPCKKALTKTVAGDTLTIWYSPDLLPQNKEYSYRFSPLPGLPLKYESKMGKLKVLFSAVKVTLEPVPSARFDIPKLGYREMTYEESKAIPSS
jgi:GLPGLI family protein